jgi:hypothetical protein
VDDHDGVAVLLLWEVEEAQELVVVFEIADRAGDDLFTWGAELRELAAGEISSDVY